MRVVGHRRRRCWIKLNYDRETAVTAFSRGFTADAAVSDAQYRTATGEVTLTIDQFASLAESSVDCRRAQDTCIGIEV